MSDVTIDLQREDNVMTMTWTFETAEEADEYYESMKEDMEAAGCENLGLEDTASEVQDG